MKFIFLFAIFLLTGCQTIAVGRFLSPAEQDSGYTYIPIDPFTVSSIPGPTCLVDKSNKQLPYLPLPKGLPDNAVRMLVEQFDSKGNVTYGLGKTSSVGQTYRVTMDFVSSDTSNFSVSITRKATKKGASEPSDVPFSGELDPLIYDQRTISYDVQWINPDLKFVVNGPYTQRFNIPIYIGIGLRVTSDIVALSADANVTGIGVIGAEADASKLKGSLIVQTLGVNGKAITAALPIQSELNRTTAQNAVVAVASIKTLLHAADTDISPRVVGLYLPFAGGKPLVNAIISELSRSPPLWVRRCI